MANLMNAAAERRMSGYFDQIGRALGRKGRREHAAKAVEVVAPMPNPSPSAALDRIVMPPELVDRIAELITPGSSLIVSDNRLSDETGEYTDFIVLTR